MDQIYGRAAICIGLFNTELQRSDLDCLQCILREHRRDKTSRVNPRAAEITLSKIANDQWCTRAWILQEAFSAGPGMGLLFPCASSVDVRGFRFVQSRVSQNDLLITLDTIQLLFERSIPLLSSTLRGGSIGTKDAETGTGEGDSQFTLRRIKFLQPQMLSRFREIVQTAGDSVHGSIRTCGAATALSLLRYRELSVLADKVAIVANMCGYHVRLHAEELEKGQKSLAACILALSLANSDFSLLVPEMYLAPRDNTIPGESPLKGFLGVVLY